MDYQPNIISGSSNRLRSKAFFLLLMAAVMPLLAILFYWTEDLQYGGIVLVLFFIPALTIFIISRKSPYFSGILAIITIPLWNLTILMLTAGLSWAGWLFDLVNCLLLAIGGISAIRQGQEGAEGEVQNHSKLAVASLILGGLTGPLFIFMVNVVYPMDAYFYYLLNILFCLIGMCLNSFGLTSGIMGIHSKYKKIAIAGVVLCSLSFIPLILFGLGWYASMVNLVHGHTWLIW